MRNGRGRGQERGIGFTPGQKLFLRVVGWGLGAFALGYLVTTLLVFPGFGREAIVTVPDLRGQTFSQARRLADRAGLEVERGAALNHPTVPRGAVLMQSPLPGQETTRGAVIRVTLSEGRARRPVPQVTDLTATQAQSLLRQMGFAVRVRRVVSQRAAGRVLGVVPDPGTVLPIPAAVELRVSSGPPEVVIPTVAVPDLSGLPEPDAREALRSAGLRVGEVGYDPGSAVPLGGVAAQSPAPGDSVKAGTAVSITVSGSPPTGAEPPPADTTGAAPPQPQGLSDG